MHETSDTICDPTESAIRRGIKTAGIGKKGSKPLPADLIAEIFQDLKAGQVPVIQQGAFFGSLLIKGLTPQEIQLTQEYFGGDVLANPQIIVKKLAPQAPEYIEGLCVKLLKGQTLEKNEADRLAEYLFSDEPDEAVCGIAASVLRVRYETPDEYEALLNAMQATMNPKFLKPVPAGPPIIQLSEPFDGVDHSYLITPAVAAGLEQSDYRVVHLVGRNSGPKFGNNLFDLAKMLQFKFLQSSLELTGEQKGGFYCHQADLSDKVDSWVERRKQIIKRPFLATLEKFFNPFKADVLITSAFHPPYTEKMVTIAERNGFPGIIVVRNGLEGTLAFALKRPVKIMCSARQKDGTYKRFEFDFEPEVRLGITVPIEEKMVNPSMKDNDHLIRNYFKDGRTDNQLFDWRVQATVLGLKEALQWINTNRG